MFDIGTIIATSVGTSFHGGIGCASVPDEQNELREIMGMIEASREKLDDLMIRYDAREEDTMILEKAADSLEDALGE